MKWTVANSGRAYGGRIALSAFVSLILLCVVPAAANAQFGFKSFGLEFVNQAGGPATQAGAHPFAVKNTIEFNTKVDPLLGEVPDGFARDLSVQLPPGLVGRPTAIPQCSNSDFINFDQNTKIPKCSDSSAVGVVSVKTFYQAGQEPFYISAPVYNLIPPPGTVQKLGFIAFGVPVAIEFKVNPEPPYNVVANLNYVPQPLPILGSELILWGNPANPAHDAERGHCILVAPLENPGIHTTGGKCETNIAEAPYITVPRSCTGSLVTQFSADSWELPGVFTGGTTLSEGLAGCGKLGFGPSIEAVPTTQSASTSSGLKFGLNVQDEALTSPTGLANSDIKQAAVTLPQGMTVNTSLAEGLAACSEADLARETLAAVPGEGCPNASKIGTVEVETPLLDESVNGSLFVAKQKENPFGSLLALYLVIKNPNLGVIVKQAIKVTPDPDTGQLVAVAGDIPQLPFSHFRLNFRGGARSPLTTAAGCGSYQASAVLTPWAGGPTVTSNSIFQITTGNNGGLCRGGKPPFRPKLEAGTLTPLAGSHSPFVLNLSREQGEDELKSIEATLPEGLLGKLAGLKECSETAILTAERRSAPGEGALEKVAPSCPAASEIGDALVGAGSGAQTFVRGRAYLAGPYRGAPLSLVVITPAVAGPFDLGTVVIRNALNVNPVTTQIHAVSDPLPTILQGIPLDIRTISVNMNRPDFILNPTSCEPMSVLAGASSLLFQHAALIAPFEVGGCGGLGFGPKLSISLKGGMRRTKNPALTAILTQPKNQANIQKVSVVLPKTEFIDNRHINNPCTRVQFNAGNCPANSILGHARAFSPLLDKPLQGPVYFRSNGGERELPDLVADLHGQINVTLTGFIDSVKVKGGGEVQPVRTRFESVPDAPVSKFVLQLKGGSRGLLQNSVNLCNGVHRARIKMTAHSGKRHDFEPAVGLNCSKRKK